MRTTRTWSRGEKDRSGARRSARAGAQPARVSWAYDKRKGWEECQPFCEEDRRSTLPRRT
jgi:hypothetical protein